MLTVREQEMVVEVFRDSTSGEVASQVRAYPACEASFRSVVIDRQKGRHMDQRAVISRAKSLAALLGARYVEDLRWQCSAVRALACRCPRCQGAEIPAIPDPAPVEMCYRHGIPVPAEES